MPDRHVGMVGGEVRMLDAAIGAVRRIRRHGAVAVMAWLTLCALPMDARAEAVHAEWVDRDWLHARVDTTANRATAATTTHALGHSVEVEHSALGASDQRRLAHPSMIKSLQDAPASSRDAADMDRYQVSALAPQSMGRLVGVSLRVEVSTPTTMRLATAPIPSTKAERHRHSASGFLRAQVEGGAKVVRVASRDQGGGAR